MGFGGGALDLDGACVGIEWSSLVLIVRMEWRCGWWMGGWECFLQLCMAVAGVLICDVCC